MFLTIIKLLSFLIFETLASFLFLEISLYFLHYWIRINWKGKFERHFSGVSHLEFIEVFSNILVMFLFLTIKSGNLLTSIFWTCLFFIIYPFINIDGGFTYPELKYGRNELIRTGKLYNLGFIFNGVDQFCGTYYLVSNGEMQGFRGSIGWIISQCRLIWLGPIDFCNFLNFSFNRNKHDPLRIAWGKSWGVLLRSAEDVAEVIGSNATKNGLGPHPGTVDLISKALPAMSLALTDAWSPIRTRIGNMTSGASSRYPELFAQSINNRLIKKWTTNSKKIVDIIDELIPLVSEIAFEHFLGLSNVPDEVHRALKDVFADVRDKVLNPLWILVGGRPQYKSQRHLVTDFIRVSIDKGLREGSLGHAAVKARGKDSAIEEILALAVASTENTIILIAWTLYELAKAPSLQNRITSAGVDDSLLRNCVQESLRLYPPAYIVVESVTNPVDLPSGYTIPAGSAVILPVLNLQRDPDYWKDDPNSFKPERWNNREGPPLSVFGGGAHQCPGRGLAQFEARHIIHTIIKNFEISITDNYLPKFDPGLTLRPAVPILLNIKNRTIYKT